MLLPEKRPGKTRKSLSVEQVKDLVLEAIPAGPRPAMWLTALMCGLRPGELAGLRWPYVDIDTDSPSIHVVERALEVEDRYIGQAVPKTPRSKRRIGLHPLLVAALRRHREDMRALELYDDEGFVFCSRNGTPMTMSNMHRAFQLLCRSRLRLGLDDLRAAPLLRLTRR